MALIYTAICNTQHKVDNFWLTGDDSEVIEAEKNIHCLKGHAFVSVYEGVVFGKSKTIRSRQCAKISRCVVIMPAIACALECRFQQTPIPKAEIATMLPYLIGVNGLNNGPI